MSSVEQEENQNQMESTELEPEEGIYAKSKK